MITSIILCYGTSKIVKLEIVWIVVIMVLGSGDGGSGNNWGGGGGQVRGWKW